MIAEVRQLLSDWLKHTDRQVWLYLPDDVGSLPCIVIDRPTMTVDAQLYTFSVPVLIVSRRTTDMDSQVELDQLTDTALSCLEGQDCAVLRVNPEVRNIAGQVYPAYNIEVALGVTRCP